MKFLEARKTVLLFQLGDKQLIYPQHLLKGPELPTV